MARRALGRVGAVWVCSKGAWRRAPDRRSEGAQQDFAQVVVLVAGGRAGLALALAEGGIIWLFRCSEGELPRAWRQAISPQWRYSRPRSLRPGQNCAKLSGPVGEWVLPGFGLLLCDGG
ncbi:hypothetical protein K505DRAFT_329237 [Melanomma pulvis-pyrius CBS 109.77]|uniref:Uncharacterized protein n=1 Tax=Melanomma pulvis-pyrius CBS 109.77 TaxID=1314802 RepID=A0A6A6WVX7_9PLEO|nr:hypothetical protein K505DRAFT_329237 [Melanomma pulvis-pyrius CBS 109.77]